MPHFTLITGTPNLPPYLYEADLAISIIPPVDYTVVPTEDTRVFLNWLKDEATTDDGFLYSQVYRSTNLTDWYLIATLDYPTASYYDHDVQVGKNYYYRVRFVRIDGEGYIINTSNYTIPMAATPVSAIGFEPRDTYSNKFFKFLIDSLPGQYIYDHTDAGWFLTNKELLWQTTCQILDGFTVKANGTVVDTQYADPTALYSKRNVGFFLNNKHTKLLGVPSSTGVDGELIQVSQYLIYTFLMGYAIQLLSLYEKYKEVVANKYIAFSQDYTLGFRPLNSTSVQPTIAELYDNFGKLLGLEPLRAYSPYQGLSAYQNLLKSSFSNIDNVGKLSAINQACANIGLTGGQQIFEYWRYPWFRADRSLKLYAMGSDGAVGQYFGYATHSGIPDPPTDPWSPTAANVNLKYTLLPGFEHFNTFVEYLQDNIVTPGNAFVRVDGSSPENPFLNIISVHMSIGSTPASIIPGVISASTSCGWLVQADASNGALSGYLMEEDRFRITRHSPWLAWEKVCISLFGKRFLLKDTSASLTTVTDTCNFGGILAISNPNSRLISGASMTGSKNYYWDAIHSVWAINDGSHSKPILPPLPATSVIISRDDSSEGCSFEFSSGIYRYSATHTGSKKVLLKMSITSEKMSWITESRLNLSIIANTKAGYLRIYRCKKDYNINSVCWNYREQQHVSTGWQWNGSGYDYITKDITTKYWDEVGVGDTDTVLISEVYIPEIAYNASGTPFSVDLTDFLQRLMKYETSNPNMSTNDPESILNCGFLIDGSALPNKSLCIFKVVPGSTPTLITKKMGEGFVTATDGVQYFFSDGTTRYGQLLVKSSDREPQNYIRTVYEVIPKDQILADSGIVLSTGAVPTSFVPGAIIYGITSKAVGKILSVGVDNITVSEELHHFSSETVRLLNDANYLLGTVTVSAVNRNGLKKIRLARAPIEGSLLKVYFMGSDTQPVITYPSTYPAYIPSSNTDGVYPVFVDTLPVGATQLYFVSQDADDSMEIHLNTTMAIDDLGTIICLYQYEFDFVPMGRVTADSQYINNIEGCPRVDSHLYAQSKTDANYRTEVFLPKPSDGQFVEFSGESSADSYSDYNLGVLANAIKSIRRLDGKVDIFKYLPISKPYKYGEQYSTFFKGV
jgi:hypothetical protein